MDQLNATNEISHEKVLHSKFLDIAVVASRLPRTPEVCMEDIDCKHLLGTRYWLISGFEYCKNAIKNKKAFKVND